MKKITVLFAFIAALTAYGQGFEDFTNSNLTASYTDGNFVGNDGITWNYVHSRDEGDYPIDGNGIMLRRADEPSSLSATIEGGIGNFTVDTRKAFTGNSQRQLELVINGDVIDQFMPVYDSGEDATVHVFDVEDINIEGQFTMELRLFGGTGNQQIILDNIAWTGYTSGGGDGCAGPTDLVLEDVGDTWIEISWTLSVDDPDDIDGYAYAVLEAGGEPFVDPHVVEEIVAVGTSAAQIAGLEADTQYDVYVVAICDLLAQEISEDFEMETFTTQPLSVQGHEAIGLSVYPNPTSDVLFLNADVTIDTIEVFNLAGQRVNTQAIGAGQAQINLATLPVGVYVLRIAANGHIATQQLIKK